jgi:hypothetical protein
LFPAINIRDGEVTGRLKIVNRSPDRCAPQPFIVQLHCTKPRSALEHTAPEMKGRFRT